MMPLGPPDYLYAALLDRLQGRIEFVLGEGNANCHVLADAVDVHELRHNTVADGNQAGTQEGRAT